MRKLWMISLLLLGCADEFQGDGAGNTDIPDEPAAAPVCQAITLSDSVQGLAQSDVVRERRYAAFCFDVKYSRECSATGSAGDVVCDTPGRLDAAPGYAVIWQSTSDALVLPALGAEQGEQLALGELAAIGSGSYRVLAYDEPLLNVTVAGSITFEFAEGTCSIELLPTGAGLTLCME